jgi:hypothetical protein
MSVSSFCQSWHACIISAKTSMHVLCCELVLFVVLLNAVLFFGFDALQERSVVAWMIGLRGTALDEALTQAQEHVAETATSVTTDNVEGLVYYIQENYEASLPALSQHVYAVITWTKRL